MMRDTALRLLVVCGLRLGVVRHLGPACADDDADTDGHRPSLEGRDPVGEAVGEALRAAEGRTYRRGARLGMCG